GSRPGRTAGSGLATVLEDGAIGHSRAKSRDENQEGRCWAHPEPIVGNGANSPHSWDRLVGDDPTRRARGQSRTSTCATGALKSAAKRPRPGSRVAGKGG